METLPRKKKVDYAALQSPFMRIPRMDVHTARCLLDLGLQEIYELQGRCAEVLFEESLKRRPNLSPNHLHTLRLAVYYANTPEPEPNRLHPEAWKF